ncbi:MAG: filamentous hemagglutinin, partial [Bradyrhizobiaceae bacterium PARB1]
LAANNDVIAQQGAKFNIAGGSVSFDGGWIYSSKLIGADGRIYSFDTAPADMRLVAAAGGFVRTHNIQGKVSDQLTEVWSSIFDRTTSRRWEDGYTVGRDAGRLNLSAPTLLFEADLVADVITGKRQSSARAAALTDGYKQVQNAAPLEGTLGLGRYGAAVGGSGLYGSDVRFGDVAAVTGGMSAGDALPLARKDTAWFDAGHINALHLGGLDIDTTDTIVIDRALTVADGGRIGFNAAVVDIKADVTARGGSLTVDNYFKGGGDRGAAQTLLKNGASSITLRDGVMLDLRGLWVNALLNRDDSSKLAYLNGGTVTLRSTHNVTLAKGSVVDISSGGAILANGKTKGGRGGDVTLIADQQAPAVQADGLLTLEGAIRAYGVSGGGTLRLESGTVIGIGGKVLATDGVLSAGEKTSVDVVLTEDYRVMPGSVLPVSYTYSISLVQPGERLGGIPQLAGLTLAADWTPPRPSSGYYFLRFNGVDVNIESDQPIPTIPAGTVIGLLGVSSGFPASYVVEGNVFPNGLRLQSPKLVTLNPGAISPVDFTVPKGTVIQAGINLTRDVTVAPNATIQSSLFQSGFSNYDVNGRYGLVVAEGVGLDIAMPIYRLTDALFNIASGGNPSRALSVWTPSEWAEDSRNSSLIQRGGASITLRSNIGEAGLTTASGPIDIRAGATIRVDAGQSISLQARDFTIDGTLTAPGGTISLTQAAASVNQSTGTRAGLIWIGDRGVLDVAARAVTAIDARGQTYGVVGNGGSILIGGAMDWEATGESVTPNAFVVIRPGALLDASGTSAVLDIPRSGLQKTSTPPFAVASNGGTIVVKSSNGLYLDGTLRAAAGGANAAGGTLALALEAPLYLTSVTSGDVLRHREFVIGNVQGDSVIASAGSLAQAKAGLVT